MTNDSSTASKSLCYLKFLSFMLQHWLKIYCEFIRKYVAVCYSQENERFRSQEMLRKNVKLEAKNEKGAYYEQKSKMLPLASIQRLY